MNEYLKNNVTGVIFPATAHLLKNRGNLDLSYATEKEYLAQMRGEKPQEEEPAELDANRITELAEAIATLDRDNPKHYLADGKPDARAISSVVGSRVTKEERDLAWDAFKEQSEE